MDIPMKYEDVVAKLEAALGRETALREELARYKSLFGQAQKAIDRLNELHPKRMGELAKRLTVAEQRYDSLRSAAQRYLDFRHTGDCGQGYQFTGVHPQTELKAALKPAAEPTIEVARQSLSFENQRIQPARFHCLACGEYHEGSGNLPCPKMKPMSGVKP